MMSSITSIRRNVLPYDRVRLNLRKEDILKPIAKENMSLGGKGLTMLSKVNLRKRTDLTKDLVKSLL